MRATGFILAALLALPAWGDNVTSTHVVDCGQNKAVPFDETLSSDRRYAIGWTVLVQNKKAKPVDWSQWDATDTSKFIDTYLSDSDEPRDKDDYAFVNCVIDLDGKTLLLLSSDNADFPQKNRGYLVAAWSLPEKGRQYAMVENDARFYTSNLWLITIDSTGMHQTDLVKSFDRATDKILRQYRPLNFGEYGTSYDAKTTSFNGSSATITFESDIPKSEDENSMVEGVLSIHLPDGAVTQVSSHSKPDDPMKEFPELAKADGELNQIYGQLSQKLDPAQRGDLKKEQLDWIKQRDNDAAEALRQSSEDPSAHDLHDARNKSLFQSTQKRLAELKGRLDALH